MTPPTVAVTRHTDAVLASITRPDPVAKYEAMSSAFDAMAASAMLFDGSYERARDRFARAEQSTEGRG